MMLSLQFFVVVILCVCVAYSCAFAGFFCSKFYHPHRKILKSQSIDNYSEGSCTREFSSSRKLKTTTTSPGKSNLMKRWTTGLSLGTVGTLWICSGSSLFTLGMHFASSIGQNEYYSMVHATGVKPAVKIGILSSFACYVAAAFLPQYHDMVMPMAVSFLMLWLLIFNKEAPKIAEISTSLLGMYYLGYLPSFWVRLRSIDAITSNHFTVLFQSFKWMNAEKWTLGAIMTWWTWCSIVFADVGAYFIGKNFGKTKLSAVCAAAGFASPNKTVEGAIGGMAACSLFSILGAYLMKYPYWPVLGFLYGIILSFIGLLGDLTASVMKRDAGIKDSGTILPGHGGLLDRIDSYMFSGPISYLFCKNLLPYLTVLGTGSKVLLKI